MRQSKKIEFWVGVFVLLGTSAALLLVLNVAGFSQFKRDNSYSLHAYFDNVGSLKEQSPVKIGGVTIGRVSSIELDKEFYLPLVTLEIDKKYGYFLDTSSAQILTSGLIGEQYIRLEPGFELEESTTLQDGDFIEDTKSALVLEELIGQVLYSMGGE